MSIEKPTEIYGNENVDFNFICIERWIEAMQSINRYRGDETVLARTHTDNPATPQSRFLNGSKKQGDVNFFSCFRRISYFRSVMTGRSREEKLKDVRFGEYGERRDDGRHRVMN